MIKTLVTLPDKTYAKLTYIASLERVNIREKAASLLEFGILEEYFEKVSKNETKKGGDK